MNFYFEALGDLPAQPPAGRDQASADSSAAAAEPPCLCPNLWKEGA